MDEAVKQAIAKWPNVPHCTGWLALDARGNWRMRDEAAQARGAAGDPIRNEALLGFIRRNYLRDEDGGWHFQNGPQRVYVDLECTPFACHSDPAQGLVLQTGAAIDPESAWMTEHGRLGFVEQEVCAVLDDRDVEPLLGQLRLAGRALSDEELMRWLEEAGATAGLSLRWQGKDLPVEFIPEDRLPARFGFVRKPRPALSSKPGGKT